MDGSIMDLLKYLPYLLAPVGAFGVWLYKQHDSFTDNLSKRLTDVEQHRAVTVVMLENLKEDIGEIKTTLYKLVERRNVKN